MNKRLHTSGNEVSSEYMEVQKGMKNLFMKASYSVYSMLKLQHRKFMLDIKKNFLIRRVVKYWNRSCREVVEFLS